MSRLPLALFDSGLGGLTVLRQVRALHPTARCLYLGDTARVPYGERSVEEIRAIAAEVVGWLRQQGVGVMVMACNTSHALAFDVAVAEAGGIPVLGLIDSVAAGIGSDRVGVLATPATAASGAYRRAIEAARPGARVWEVGCPAFVPLIEAGNLQDPDLLQAARTYLAPLLEAQVDTIVLGCTHYPLLSELLGQLLPPEVRLVDPAVATARRLSPLLAAQGDPAAAAGAPGEAPMEAQAEPSAGIDFCVTGSAAAFARSATPWLGFTPAVRQVSLTSAARVP